MHRQAGKWAAVALAVVLAVGCGAGRGGLTREQAIEQARREAGESAPEMGILEARIDQVTAERITLATAEGRRGSECVAGTRTGAPDCDAPVWWVHVQGYFRYEGMPAPEAGHPVYEADERYFIYDVKTGEALGGGVPASRRVNETEEVGIYALVATHLASVQASPGQGRWPAIFIQPRLAARLGPPTEPASDGGEVPRELLIALQDLAPRVEFTEPEDALQPDLSVRDGGILITLGPITMDEDGTAVMAAEYHLGGLGGAGYEYHLRRGDGGWWVVKALVRYLS